MIRNLLVAWASFAVASFAQEVIDGSKTPWLIADSQAYQALLNVLSATGRSSWDMKTKTAWLAQGGFGKEDAAIAIAVAGTHSDRLDAIKNKGGSVPQQERARYTALTESIAELHRRLSPEANKRLVQFVEGMKKNMRGVRGSMPDHAGHGAGPAPRSPAR